MEQEKNIVNLNELQITKWFKNQVPEVPQPGTKFFDPHFLANADSLLSPEYHNGQLLNEQMEFVRKEIKSDNIEWKRVSEIFGEDNYDIFQDKIEVRDIKQGELSDCYFLSALASLTEFPDFIYQRFVTQKVSWEGFYVIIFFIDGEWQKVFVDDYFPVEKGTKSLAFTQTNGTEIWPILLEKAWAKVNGGYSNIVLGHVSDAFQALTGFPIEHISEADKIDKKDLWALLQGSDSKDYIICTGTKNEAFVENSGLVRGHAYCLVSVKEKEYEGTPIQLLKIFNPWGRKEWTGSWSDQSPLWNEELTAAFEKVDEDDGTFFMDINDYPNYYKSLYICHLMYGATLRSYHISQEYSQKPLLFKLTLNEDSKVSISTFFKHWRFNRSLCGKSHPFSIILAKINNKGSVELIDGDFALGGDIQLVRDLFAGTYLIWLYSANPENSNDYVFRVASEKKLDPIFLGEDVNFNTIKNIIISNRKIVNEKDHSGRKDMVVDYDFSLKKYGLLSYVGVNYSKRPMDIKLTFGHDENNLKVLMTNYSKSTSVITDPGCEFAVIAIRTSSVDELFKVITNRKPKKDPLNANAPLSDEALKILVKSTDPSPYSFTQTTYSFPQADELKIVRKFRKLGEKTIEKYTFNHFREIDESIAAKLQRRFELVGLDLDNTKLTILEEASGKYMGQDFLELPKDTVYYGSKRWELSKEVYVGAFKNGKPDGYGIIYINNQLLYKGQFKQGFKHGPGVLSNEDFYYEGKMHRGKFKGLTKIFNKMTNQISFCILDSGIRNGYSVEVEYPAKGTKIVYYKKGNLYKSKAFMFDDIAYLADERILKTYDEEEFTENCKRHFPLEGMSNLFDQARADEEARAKMKKEHQMQYDMAHQFWPFQLKFPKEEIEDWGSTVYVDRNQSHISNHAINHFTNHNMYRIYDAISNETIFVKQNGNLLLDGKIGYMDNFIKEGKILTDEGEYIEMFKDDNKHLDLAKRLFIYYSPVKGFYSGQFNYETHNFEGPVIHSPLDDNFVYYLNFNSDGSIELKETKNKNAIESEVRSKMKKFKSLPTSIGMALIKSVFPYFYVIPEGELSMFLNFKPQSSDTIKAYRLDNCIFNYKECGGVTYYKKINQYKTVGAKSLTDFMAFEVFGEFSGMQPHGRCFFDNKKTQEYTVFDDFKKNGVCFEKKVVEGEEICEAHWCVDNNRLAEVFDLPDPKYKENEHKENIYQNYSNTYRWELNLLFTNYAKSIDLKLETQYLLDGFYIGQVNHVGQPHGRGLIIFNNKSYVKGVYVGQWLGGLRHGDGVYISKEKGLWCGMECIYGEVYGDNKDPIPNNISDYLNKTYSFVNFDNIFNNRSDEPKTDVSYFSLGDISKLKSAILKVREILWDINNVYKC